MQSNRQIRACSARSGMFLAIVGAVTFAVAFSGCSKAPAPAPQASDSKTAAPQPAATPTAAKPAAAPAAPQPAPAAPEPAAAPQPAATPAASPAAAPAGDADATRKLIEEKMRQARPASAAPTTAPAAPPAASEGKPAAGTAPSAAAAAGPAATPDKEWTGKTPILDGETLDMVSPPEGQPQPKVVFDREVFVADPIWRGQTARFVFNVRNEGEGILNLKMKSCCGLSINGVRSGWPGWSLKPGESEMFEMTLAPSAGGEFTRFSPAHTNDPKAPKVNFTCKGRVLVPFNMTPRVVNLGKPESITGPVTRTLTITRGDGGALQPKLLPPKDPRVKAELKEVQPGERYTLDVTVTPPLPEGEYRSALILETGLPEAPRDTILIVTEVEKAEH